MISHDLSIYADEESARAAAQELMKTFTSIADGMITVSPHGKPVAVMSVRQLLGALGISGISFAIASGRVKQGNILEVPGAIVVPS